MSTHPANPKDEFAAHEAGISVKKVVAVGVISLAVFAISAVAANLILKAETARLRAGGTAPPPALIGKDEIGLVDQPVFEADRRLEIWQADRQRHLGSYGWVDRGKGIAHVPIDRAMKQVVREASQAGGQR
jgi:hypothetical protein